MKSKISLMFFFSALVLFSCKKENDIGIQIDGNGKPGSASITSGTSLDPSGRPNTTGSNIGIQIDGNGKPVSASLTSGTSIDPSGRPSGTLNNAGPLIDPNGKPKPGAQGNYGIAIDPDGYGIAIDPDGYGIAIDPDGKPMP